MGYLEISGLIFNVLVFGAVSYAAWIFIAWPMIEAISMCRWYAEIGRHYPDVKPTKGWLCLWWSCVDIGGRGYESTSNKYGRWSGVGRWYVNAGESQS